MDYYKVFLWANAGAHRGRVTVALNATARSILLEDPSTPDHDKRVLWATRYRRSGKPGVNPEQLMYLIIAQSPTLINSVEADLSVLDEDAYAAALQPVVNAVVSGELTTDLIV